jgi:large subunit ribosomal protein L22
MEITATTKYIKMSPTKARDLANEIKGLPVSDALFITEFNARKAAIQIGKTLKSALANAEHNQGLSADQLIVKNAIVDGGPMMKRYRPRARGSASPIQKKTSHITIVLSDQA